MMIIIVIIIIIILIRLFPVFGRRIVNLFVQQTNVSQFELQVELKTVKHT